MPSSLSRETASRPVRPAPRRRVARRRVDPRRTSTRWPQRPWRRRASHLPPGNPGTWREQGGGSRRGSGAISCAVILSTRGREGSNRSRAAAVPIVPWMGQRPFARSGNVLQEEGRPVPAEGGDGSCHAVRLLLSQRPSGRPPGMGSGLMDGARLLYLAWVWFHLVAALLWEPRGGRR